MLDLPKGLPANRLGRMSWRQRRRFLLVALLPTSFPVVIGLEVFLTARAGGVHLTADNFLVLFVLIPFTMLVLGGLGLVILLEGALGKCRSTTGVPSPYRWEKVSKRIRGRQVLINGCVVGVPAGDYDTLIASARPIRVYCSWILRSSLGWEFVARESSQADAMSQGSPDTSPEL
jgi:hypothetical protein